MNVVRSHLHEEAREREMVVPSTDSNHLLRPVTGLVFGVPR